jgi:hypothetical protein
MGQYMFATIINNNNHKNSPFALKGNILPLCNLNAHESETNRTLRWESDDAMRREPEIASCGSQTRQRPRSSRRLGRAVDRLLNFCSVFMEQQQTETHVILTPTGHCSQNVGTSHVWTGEQLGPVASTIITRPPRTTYQLKKKVKSWFNCT